jgi:Zn-finger nucleic acid-binding protein
MKCPKGDGNLRRVQLGPTFIDVCDVCKGSWYDVGELRVLKDLEAGGDYSWIDVDIWRHLKEFRAPEQRGLTCPVDDAALTSVRYGETGVTVDACKKCHGVWLDKNEYDQIVKQLEQRVNTESLGEYVKDLREEFVKMFMGAESPVEGLRHLDRVIYLMQLRFGAEHPGIAAILRQF